MTAKNDITGDSIRSRVNSKAYEDNFDAIFRKPKADPEGWIDWPGGECPVPVGTLVDVMYRDNEIMLGVEAGVEGGWAEDWSHDEYENTGDIIKYRLAKQ